MLFIVNALQEIFVFFGWEHVQNLFAWFGTGFILRQFWLRKKRLMLEEGKSPLASSFWAIASWWTLFDLFIYGVALAVSTYFITYYDWIKSGTGPQLENANFLGNWTFFLLCALAFFIFMALISIAHSPDSEVLIAPGLYLLISIGIGIAAFFAQERLAPGSNLSLIHALTQGAGTFVTLIFLDKAYRADTNKKALINMVLSWTIGSLLTGLGSASMYGLWDRIASVATYLL